MTGFSNSCCTQKQERKQTAQCQDKWLMKGGGVITFMSCKPSSDAKMSPLCFPVVRFRNNVWKLLQNFTTSFSFYASGVSFERICYTFAKKPDKLFWTTLKKTTSALVGKWLEHLESSNILRAHRPKTLKSSIVQGHNFCAVMECMCNHVVHRLFVATSQLTNDHRVQTLRVDTNQLALIRDLTVHWVYWLASRHGDTWTEQYAWLGAQRLAQVCIIGTNCP